MPWLVSRSKVERQGEGERRIVGRRTGVGWVPIGRGIRRFDGLKERKKARCQLSKNRADFDAIEEMNAQTPATRLTRSSPVVRKKIDGRGVGWLGQCM